MRFIQRKSNAHEINNTSQDVLICPADRKVRVLSLYIYNPNNTLSSTKVEIEKNSLNPITFFDYSIPSGDSHSLFSDNIYLEPGDKIIVSTTGIVHTVISYKEIKAI